MDVRASVITGLMEPWRTETIQIDDPKTGEVRVKMAFSGMCHSDEHLRTGDISADPMVLEILSGKPSMFPIVGGHEGSGVVEAVGPGVTGFKEGDHVAVSFVPSCGKCPSCADGKQYICDMGATTLAGPMISDGTWRHHFNDENLNRMAQLGTFAEYIVVNEASLVKIEPWQDLRAAALISCGLSTGFGSAATRGNVRPGDVVAVIGCGGVGSGAIQGALHAGARAVVAIDIEPSKVERALKLGATHGAASTLDAAFTILPELTWGKNCDVVIITVDVLKGELIEQARSITAKGGTVVATAIAPFSQKTVELDLFMFSMFNQQLLGTTFGSVAPRIQIPRLLRLYHEGKLVVDDLITKEYTLDQVQQGYDDVYNGHNVRGVIRF